MLVRRKEEMGGRWGYASLIYYRHGSTGKF